MFFKFPFDDCDSHIKKAIDKYNSFIGPKNITLDNLCYESQHEFYENIINNSYNYTKQFAELELSQLAEFQLGTFYDDNYKLFEQCIDQFNNLEY